MRAPLDPRMGAGGALPPPPTMSMNFGAPAQHMSPFRYCCALGACLLCVNALAVRQCATAAI
jgi:hypothetical protein